MGTIQDKVLRAANTREISSTRDVWLCRFFVWINSCHHNNILERLMVHINNNVLCCLDNLCEAEGLHETKENYERDFGDVQG